MTELTEQERMLLSVIRESTEDAKEEGRSEEKQNSQAFRDAIGKDYKDQNTNQNKETNLKSDFKDIFAPWLEAQLDAHVPDWKKDSGKKILDLYKHTFGKPKFKDDGRPCWDTGVFLKVINAFHTEIFSSVETKENFGTLFRPIQTSRTAGAAHEHTHDDKAIQTLAINYIRFLKPLNLKPTDRMLQYSEGKDPLLTKIQDHKPIPKQNTVRPTDDAARGSYYDDMKPGPGDSTSAHHLEQDIHQETDVLDCDSPSAIDDTAHDQEIDVIAESIIETPVIERGQVPSIEDEFDLADSDAIALAPDSLVSLERAGAGISDTLEKPNFEISQSITIKSALIAVCLLVLILFPIYFINADSGPTVNQITASWEQYRINGVGPTFEDPVSESNVASFYNEQLELVDMEQYQESIRLAEFLLCFPYSKQSTIYAFVCYRQAANVAEDKPKTVAAFEGARSVLDNSEGVLSVTEKKRYFKKLENEIEAYAVASEPAARY